MLAAAYPAYSSDTLSKCTLSVGDAFSYQGMCIINKGEAFSVVYLLTPATVNRMEPEYFFYLPLGEDDLASWNGRPFARHAQTLLGKGLWDHDCFSGPQLELCYQPLW